VKVSSSALATSVRVGEIARVIVLKREPAVTDSADDSFGL
jgi:hypothetical protein